MLTAYRILNTDHQLELKPYKKIKKNINQTSNKQSYFMSYALSFKDLETYKLAREISFEIYNLSKQFPSEEKYSLTDQIRRSSRSVGAQIAECWRKRRYPKHFISKLSDADSELFETQHWLDVSNECEYISEHTLKSLNEKCILLGKMIGNMMQKADKFCQLN